MIPKIKSVKPLDNYILHVVFDDGKDCIYDVKDDMDNIKSYEDLRSIYGLFEQVQLDESRTCIFWTDYIDLPSDAIYEHGLAWDPARVIPGERATPDEVEAIERANKSIAEHGTVPHDAINWD